MIIPQSSGKLVSALNYGIFLRSVPGTQGLNWGLLETRKIFYVKILASITFPFLSYLKFIDKFYAKDPIAYLWNLKYLFYESRRMCEFQTITQVYFIYLFSFLHSDNEGWLELPYRLENWCLRETEHLWKKNCFAWTRSHS